MKREELMINDIVFDYTNSPVKVCAVGQDIVVKNSFGIGSLDPNELSSIPLTEEILVKNGFERHPLWHHCTLEVGDGSKIYIPLACGGGIEYVSIYKHSEELTTRDIDIQIPIHYVHQLQHLLRLAGIEKEIEL